MGVLQAVSLPPKLRQVLEPLLKEVESLTDKIKDSDREIEQIARKDYPETALLQQVGGVGPLIALTFILTVEDKDRLQKSRDIGCYVGLRPRRSDSGQSQPQLRITKEGDPYLRTMLMQGAHYIVRDVLMGFGFGVTIIMRHGHRARAPARASLIRAMEASA